MSKSSQPYDYHKIDPFKVLALEGARQTNQLAEGRGYFPDGFSWGESAFTGRLELDPNGGIVTRAIHPASVLESLGTKILVADAVQRELGLNLHSQVAQDNLAMSVNDLITIGALPFCFHLLVAVGSDEWFANQKRAKGIVSGTVDACVRARCVWGGGETPTLVDIIYPDAAVLASTSFGVITDKQHALSGSQIRNGDAIIVLNSSGVHSNGISRLRQIAAQLPEGYGAKLSDGRTFGEAILDATLIYSNVIEDCQREGIKLHYAVNVTGHGWAKLMRATEKFRYLITELPKPQPIFSFIQEQANLDDRQMYSSYNMGGGFALFAPEKEADRIIKVCFDLGFQATVVGHIEKSDRREVVLQQLGITFNELAIR